MPKRRQQKMEKNQKKFVYKKWHWKVAALKPEKQKKDFRFFLEKKKLKG
jgi:hypothetical protein